MVSLDKIPSVDSLVYEFFLRRNSRLAARVKKELKADKPPANSPNIEQIWADWLETQKKKKQQKGSGDGESSSSESDDEKPAPTLPVSPKKTPAPVASPKKAAVVPVMKKVEDSESSDSSEDELPAGKQQAPAPKAAIAANPAESSSEESSDEDEGTPKNGRVVTKPAANVVNKATINKEDSSSDSSDDDEPAPRKVVPLPKPAVVIPAKANPKAESESSDSASSDDETPALPVKAAFVKTSPVAKTIPVAVTKKESSDDSSSEEETAATVVPKVNGVTKAVKKEEDSDDSSSEEETAAKVVPKVNGVTKAVKMEEDSDDSSEEDDPDTKKPVVAVPKVNSVTKAIKKEESSDSSSEDEEESKPASRATPLNPVAFVPASDSKKRKMNGETPGKKVKEADEATPASKKKKPNVPFKRIPDHVTSTTPALNDNSFESKQGFDEWGKKANQSLSAVKGKNFKKEKTKKKRGSYTGGAINTGVNSIKFA